MATNGIDNEQQNTVHRFMLLFHYFLIKKMEEEYIDDFSFEHKNYSTFAYVRKNNSPKSAINRLFFIRSGIKLASNRNLLRAITQKLSKMDLRLLLQDFQFL